MGEAEAERTGESRAAWGRSRPIWSFIIPFKAFVIVHQDAGNREGDQGRANQFWINREVHENTGARWRSQSTPDLPWNSENHPGSIISSSLPVPLKNTTPEYVSLLVRSAFIEAGD